MVGQVDWLWPLIIAVLGIVSAAAGVVLYVVRQETRAVKDLVILDRETMKLRLGSLENSVTKIENAVAMIADYKWQLKLIDERVVAQGQRLDDVTRRFNDYTDMEIKKIVASLSRPIGQ